MLRSKLISIFWILCLGFCIGWLILINTYTGLVIADEIKSSTDSSTYIQNIKKGQYLYEVGRFSEAVQIWLQVKPDLEQSYQALVYSYLALAEQNLGQTKLAEIYIQRGLSLIKATQNQFIYAQILNHYGEVLYRQGKLETAVDIWQQAQKIYGQLGDKSGELGTQINQARALQGLGMYRRARNLLESLSISWQKQPVSSLQIDGLITLGNILRLTGSFKTAQINLEQASVLAQKSHDIQRQLLALFNLGNLAADQQEFTRAIDYYQQILDSPEQNANPELKIATQVKLLGLLIKTQAYNQAKEIIPPLQTQLQQQPLTQTIVYIQIELGRYLARLKQVIPAVETLTQAAKNARIIGNPRGESYALGELGKIYEQNRQWSEAKKLTQQALNLVSATTAPEIAYEWEWQMGRLSNYTGAKAEAIIHYRQALTILRSLRQDLAAISPDIQFSFRDRVEPVYRQFVDLLLTPSIPTSQANLLEARQTIEDLQLAELTNFFRQACVDNQPRKINQIDTNAAVIYPIILSDRLEVILSLPGKPLTHHTTFIPQPQIEQDIQTMRQSLRRTSFLQERQTIAEKIYTWLMQPIIPQIKQSQIKTLVFVLDGSLRNIPVSALFDGKQYLIENYQITLALATPKGKIAPSGQRLNLPPFSPYQSKVLLGGLSQSNQEFTSLPGVKTEIEKIYNLFRNTQPRRPIQILLDQEFTTQALTQKITNQSHDIIHLATHGQFSSQAENNFILTNDGKLDISTLDQIISQRQLSDPSPLKLLVLSACQTAQGDNRATLGLAGVTVRSGADSTLASLWTINDESTPLFMVKFYEQLLTPGVSKAEALRQAQLYLLQHTQYNHPYFWASFILIGS